MMEYSGHPETKTENFLFFVQYTGDHNSYIEAMLGLSPRDDSAGPLIVEEMYNQGRIPEQQFSILMTDLMDPPNKMTLGGYDQRG